MAPHPTFPDVEHLSLVQLLQLPYKEQAIWFLNGFWADADGGLKHEAEELWRWTKEFAELDSKMAFGAKGAAGAELDPMMSARFLEMNEEALTSVDRKAAMKEIDVNNDGQMALIEYLMFRYKKQPPTVVGAQQGKAQEISACQRVIDQALSMLPEIEAKLAAQRIARQEQTAALKETRNAKSVAAAALETQREAEGVHRTALAVLEESKGALLAALADLAAQEQALADEMAKCERIWADNTAGAVARGRAANQLNGLKKEDPLPLRKAKITAEAALRKMGKKEAVATAAADESAVLTAVCAAKFDDFATKERMLEESIAAVAAAVAGLEHAYAEMETKMREAQAAVEELKSSECGLGSVWWMERELFEADESLPRAKQQYDHSAPFSFTPGRRGSYMFGAPAARAMTAAAAASVVSEAAFEQVTEDATEDMAQGAVEDVVESGHKELKIAPSQETEVAACDNALSG